MLEHVPAWLGHALRTLRAGHDGLATAQPGLGLGEGRLDLSSPAFGDGGRLPERFTADGEGVSPPLVWGNPPEGARAFALIVEDPDAPAMSPLVHALVWGIDGDERRLPEGALSGGSDQADGEIGRNSYLSASWLPPDPPTGHGVHDYVFQLFALKDVAPLGDRFGRSDVVKALEGNVLAADVLIGTYSRGEPDPGSDVAAVAAS